MNAPQYRDWHEVLREFLIAAGTNGRKQKEIVARLQPYVAADEIEPYLTLLQSERKVQKFRVPPSKRGGRPSTVWRATTEWMKGESDV